MTISSEDRKDGPYACNGVTTVFAFAFKVFTTAEVRVVLADSAGVETDLTLNTHYTVSLNADQDNNPGGSVTTIGAASPYASGNTLTLTSDVQETQGTELPSGGGWFPKVVERALDRLTILMQQALLLVRGALRQPISDVATIDELPTKTARASKFLAFDADGDPIAATSVTGTPVTAFMTTVLEAVDAAAARATIGAVGLTGNETIAGTKTFSGLLTMMAKSIHQAEGAAVASAGTIGIWATDGDTIHITGNTGPITSMGIAPQAGCWKNLIFDSTPTLTQGANLNLNGGGANIVIEAGDAAFVYARTTTQLDVFVIRKSGASVVAAAAPVAYFTTGDVKLTLKTAADSGWVMCNDGTIGNAASGGTTRANADTVDLFTLLWNNVADAQAAVSGGRGASAAADYAANKTIALTKMLGRAFAAAGAGAGLTSRVLGLATGTETHVLVTAEMPSHSHQQQINTVSAIGTGVTYNPATAETATPSAGSLPATGTAGSNTAHPNMQPSAFLNAMIKL